VLWYLDREDGEALPARPPSPTIPNPGAPQAPETLEFAAAVNRVIDGDTIEVVLAGTEVRVRLIGVDAPETVTPDRPVECFGPEAAYFALLSLSNQTVALEADATQGDTDQFGRTLAYVWLPNGQMFNWLAVQAGYAREATFAEPYRYQASFRRAEAEARQAGRGLWDPAGCAAGG
jgi:micrococcal nuclease